MLAALWDRLVLTHWRALDEEARVEPSGALGPQLKAVTTIVVSGLVLTFMQYIVLRGTLQNAVSTQLPLLVGHLWPEWGTALENYRPLIRNITWSLGCAFFYLVIPAIVIRLVFKETLKDYGMSPQGYFRHLWIYALLFIPVGVLVWMVSYTPQFQQGYPFYKNPILMKDLLVWEAFYALQFFCLEFFFRGFMIKGLKARFGAASILFMVVPYCMIHFQKPFLETMGAIIAGLVLGLLALRTRSIWGGATIHVAVAFSMDMAALWQKGQLPPWTSG